MTSAFSQEMLDLLERLRVALPGTNICVEIQHSPGTDGSFFQVNVTRKNDNCITYGSGPTIGLSYGYTNTGNDEGTINNVQANGMDIEQMIGKVIDCWKSKQKIPMPRLPLPPTTPEISKSAGT